MSKVAMTFPKPVGHELTSDALVPTTPTESES